MGPIRPVSSASGMKSPGEASSTLISMLIALGILIVAALLCARGASDVAAVTLELSTIPPYLCALYSMHPRGNDEAKLVIRSVVVPAGPPYHESCAGD